MEVAAEFASFPEPMGEDTHVMIHPQLAAALHSVVAQLPSPSADAGPVEVDDGTCLGLLVGLVLRNAERIDELEAEVARLTNQGVADTATTTTVIDWLAEMQDRMNGPLPSLEVL